MIDVIMYFLGNMTGSNQEMKEHVRQSFDITKIMADLVEGASGRQITIPKMFISNYIWVANNLSKSQSLTEEEVKNLCYLFITQIGKFLTKSQKDEMTLIDLLEGLANLSATPAEAQVALVTGFGIFPEGNEIIPHIIDLLGSKHELIFKWSLKYVGGVLGSENKEATDKI